MEKVKEEGSKQAEEVRQMMSERLEKQMSMIEALLEDKKCLADKIEELRTKIKEADKSNEKTRKLMEEKL